MRKFKVYIGIALLCFVFTSCAELLTLANQKKNTLPGTISPNVEYTRDIVYATEGGRAIKCDVFKNKNNTGSAGAIIYVHGGGWKGGNKSAQKGFNNKLAENGFTVISINYRKAGGQNKVSHPAQINDVNAAIRWVKGNAKMLGINKNKIGLVGNSAGGHLSSLAALATNNSTLVGKVGNHDNETTNVQAVVNFYGPIDLINMTKDKDCKSCLVNYDTDPTSPILALLGCFMSQCPDKAEAASPINYVTAKAPPFLHFHGTKDRIVPIEQSRRLNKALQNVGVSSRLIECAGYTHDESLNSIYFNDVLKFFNAHLN